MRFPNVWDWGMKRPAFEGATLNYFLAVECVCLIRLLTIPIELRETNWDVETRWCPLLRRRGNKLQCVVEHNKKNTFGGARTWLAIATNNTHCGSCLDRVWPIAERSRRKPVWIGLEVEFNFKALVERSETTIGTLVRRTREPSNVRRLFAVWNSDLDGRALNCAAVPKQKKNSFSSFPHREEEEECLLLGKRLAPACARRKIKIRGC